MPCHALPTSLSFIFYVVITSFAKSHNKHNIQFSHSFKVMEIITKRQNVPAEANDTLINNYRQVFAKNFIDLAGFESRNISLEDVRNVKKCGIRFEFINPRCKFIIRTITDVNRVINICSSQYVNESKCIESDNCSLYYHIFTPIEYENGAIVYDVVFHPSVLEYVARKLNICDFVLNVACEVLTFNCSPEVCTKNGNFVKVSKKSVVRQINVRANKKINSKKSCKNFKNLQENIEVYDIYNYLNLNLAVSARNLLSCLDVSLHKSSEGKILHVVHDSLSLMGSSKKFENILSHESNNRLLNFYIYLYTKEYSRIVLNNVTKHITYKPRIRNLANLTEKVVGVKSYFLNLDVKYQLPEYSCHLFNDIIIFTLHVKNVKPDTLDKIFDKNDSAIHMKFSSTSASTQNHYAFYLHLPSHVIDSENVTIEAWDNNVVVQIPFIPRNEGISSYMVGVSENDLNEKIIEEPSIIFNKQINKNIKEDIANIHAEIHSDEEISVVHLIKNETYTEIPSKNNSIEEIPSSQDSNTILLNNKNRLPSESSGDELSLSVSPTKGILKLRRPRIATSRSVSESSVDDCIWSSFENYNSLSDCIIHEEHSSIKKTVRFNDVVSRQLFR